MSAQEQENQDAQPYHDGQDVPPRAGQQPSHHRARRAYRAKRAQRPATRDGRETETQDGQETSVLRQELDIAERAGEPI